MSSLINRLFHKILAKRIENTIVLDPRQKAFIRRDGIAENIFVLKNIIYQHKQKLRPLKICLLDVSKNFTQFLTTLLFLLLIELDYRKQS